MDAASTAIEDENERSSLSSSATVQGSSGRGFGLSTDEKLAALWLGSLFAFLLLALQAMAGDVAWLDLRLAELIRGAPGFVEPLFRLDNALGRPRVFALLLLACSCLLAARRHDIEA